MKVKMIGTGAIYTKYNSASTLINNNLIVDMPNGTLKQLLKMNIKPENIKTIVITHMHGDHTADLPFFLKYVVRYIQSDNEEKLNNKIKLIGPQGIKEQLEKLFDAYRFEDKEEINQFFNIEYIEVNNFDEIEIDNEYKIKAYLVSHGEEKPAFGYIINDILGFTGDSGLCDGIENIFNKAKAIISDCSHILGDDSHLGIDNIKYLIEKYNKKIIATHLRDTTRQELIRQPITNIDVVEDEYEFEI